jgi:ABC-type Mn2+/Zn2+ transport system permease subunit
LRWEVSSLRGFVLVRKSRLVVALVSPDIARTAAIPVSRLSLEFLCCFALTVALGLRYLGVLLMGSLIIIPATTAKHLARNLSGMLKISVFLAVLATLAGTWAARFLHRPSGPIIILVAGALFCLSLFRRRPS